jgi:hypothetical protein
MSSPRMSWTRGRDGRRPELRLRPFRAEDEAEAANGLPLYTGNAQEFDVYPDSVCAR